MGLSFMATHWWVCSVLHTFSFSELYSDNVNYQDYIPLVMIEWMSMKHWWNNSDRGKPKYLEENLSQCQSLDHKSHTNSPGTEPWPLQWEVSNQLPQQHGLFHKHTNLKLALNTAYQSEGIYMLSTQIHVLYMYLNYILKMKRLFSFRNYCWHITEHKIVWVHYQRQPNPAVFVCIHICVILSSWCLMNAIKFSEL